MDDILTLCNWSQIWAVKYLGKFKKEEATFTSERLEDHKGQASCFELQVNDKTASRALTERLEVDARP
jgi:hypothetical protein